MLKNLYELIALKDDENRKTLGMNAHYQMQGLMLIPTVSTHTHESGGNFTIKYFCYYCIAL